MLVLIMLKCVFVVAYYLLWCGTVGTVYSHFTYDNMQHYFPFIGYYDSKVCITAYHFTLIVIYTYDYVEGVLSLMPL